MRAAGAALAVVLVGALVGCGDSGPAATDATSEGGGGTIVVSAAASLAAVVGEIAKEYEAAHPDSSITVNSGSSGELAEQILAGAPADVAAFADTRPMDDLDGAGLLGSPPRVIATNDLVLVTPADAPVPVTSLKGLRGAGTVSLCVETAPCGAYAERVLDVAGVRLVESSVTRGRDATATIAAVTRGDADAALVYRTDAIAAGDAVRASEVDTAGVVAEYPVAVLAGSERPVLAADFVEFLSGDGGRRALAAAGFGAP